MDTAALLLLALLPLATPAGPAGKPGETVVVRREGTRLMRAPRFFGASCVAATVKPGERVKVLERQRGWARIASPGEGACWLHETAWSDRTASASAGGGAAGAASSQRDVELAARGFSEAEEARFRGEHRDLDAGYQAVDAHLARGAPPAPEELERFRAEGGIGGGK